VSLGIAIPQSFLRYDISSAMTGAIGTLSAVGPAVIVSMGYGLVAVVSFSLCLNVVAVAIYALIAYRLMRGVPLSEGPVWKDIRRKTLSFAGLAAVSRIGQTLTGETSRLVVGIASGVGAAAYYQVPYMLASRVNDMLSKVAQVLFPTASGLLAREDLKGVQQLYLHASRLFFVLNFSVTAALCVLANPLLKYWVSEDYATRGALALAIFSLSQSLHATSMAASYINLSAARPGINLVFSSTANVISLVLVYPLTVRFGINGAATAGLIAALNIPFFLHYGHRHVLRLSSGLVWRRCYQPTVLGASIVAAAAYFVVLPLCRSLLTTLAVWCVVVVASMAVSGLLGAVKREDLIAGWRLTLAPLRRLRARGATETPKAHQSRSEE
jgi:O-antigen/teichoic acid export membrane protein